VSVERNAETILVIEVAIPRPGPIQPGVVENRSRIGQGKVLVQEYHFVTMDPDWAPGPAKE
jgi:hypothetical protein